MEIVYSFKLLSTIITSSPSWDQHVTYICSKASKILYAIRLLKRSGVSVSDLTRIFCSVVRRILENGCQIWHFSLTEKQSNQIEQIERRANKTILPDQIYYDLVRLERLKLITLAERREELCRKSFQSFTQNKNHKLNGLLPQPRKRIYSLRNPREFPMFKAKTDRFAKSFIFQSVTLFDNCS